MKQEQIIVINEADDGQRLDRWLKKHMPFGLAQKLVRKGAIRVDGKRVKGDVKLSTGQEVRIPPIEAKAKPEKKPLSSKDSAFIKSLVIYDDGDVLAINKPAGLATQGGGDEKRHIDGMLEGLKDRKGLVPRLVHRLDKDTSGVLLLARSAAAVRELGHMFKGRDIKKTYLAITMPAPEPNEGTIKAPIGKVKGPIKDKMMIDESDDGKKAATEFIVVERAAQQAAFVAFRPLTGRTHQIRVHAASILEAPILGDGKYGGALTDDDELAAAQRLHLHAWRVSLHHPLKPKQILEITAPLPDDLKKSWKAFGFDANLNDDPFEQD